MKKLLSVVLALVMVLALGVTAFADTVTIGTSQDSPNTWDGSTNWEKSVNVTGSYTSGSQTSATIYYVNITWNVTAAVYKDAEEEYTWDPDTLTYSKNADASTAKVETPATVSVKVENRSNAEVKAALNYSQTTSIEQTATWKSSEAEITEANQGTDYAANGQKLTLSSAADSATYDGTKGKEQYAYFSGSIIVTNPAEDLATDTVIGTITITLTK